MQWSQVPVSVLDSAQRHVALHLEEYRERRDSYLRPTMRPLVWRAVSRDTIIDIVEAFVAQRAQRELSDADPQLYRAVAAP